MGTQKGGLAMKKLEAFRDKMRELILYVSQRSQDDPNFGATKLNKILFEADRLAYIRLGRSITGKTYQKLPGGPALRALLPVQTSMIAAGEIEIEKRVIPGYTNPQIRLIAKRDPLKVFSSAEEAIIDEAIRVLWPLTGTQASNRSHKFPAWSCVDYRETIPFEALLWKRPDSLTPDVIAKAKARVALIAGTAR